jgi:hypothetical protein
MESDFYKEDYFDFKRLAIDERYIKTPAGNCEYAYQTCLSAAKDNTRVGLITEPGYGIRSGIEDFIKRTGFRYYYAKCTNAKRLKQILIEFLYVDIPIFIKLENSNVDHLVKSIGYKFRNDERKHRIIVLYNCENLSIREFGALYNLSEETKGHAGFVIGLNKARFKLLQNISTKLSDVNNFLSVFDWRELPPPDPNELAQHCLSRGVLAKKLIDRLLDKASDFRILNREINKIRTLLIDKGYLKQDQ